MKILSDDISHKSDVGGVRLGLTSADEAREAARAMCHRRGAALRQMRGSSGFTVRADDRAARVRTS